MAQLIEAQRNESFSDFLARSQRTMAAGGIAGCVAKTIMAPLSRLTILFQVGPMLSSASGGGALAVKNNQFSGSLYSVGARVLKEEGVLSFWKGNLTSVIHRFPYSAINFTVYDRLRTSFRNLNYRESPFTRFICGATAGGTACFACYPLDLVRTRLTVLKTPSACASSSVYGNITSIMYSIVKTEGIMGLYRGVLISVCVTTPTFGISFCVYGTVKEKLLNFISPYNIFKEENSGKLSNYGTMLCGAMSGITSSLIMFPADSIRRRMQVAGFLNLQKKQNNLDTLSPTNSVAITNNSSNHINTVSSSSSSSSGSSNQTSYYRHQTTPPSTPSSLSTSSISSSSSGSSSRMEFSSSSSSGSTSNSNSTLNPTSSSSSSSSSNSNSLKNIKNILHRNQHHSSSYFNFSYNFNFSFTSSEIFKVLKGDGYRGLYRGIVPELLKVTPMVSITFCVYEFTYDLLNRS